MTNSKIAAVVLGAGKGTRMKSELPKVLMPVCGKPMISHILKTLDSMKTDKIVVVTAPDGEAVREAVAPHESVVQEEQLGTGNAVMAAESALRGFDGDVLTVFGDHPIITRETFLRAVAKRREGYAVVVIGFCPEDAARYGRLVVKDGELQKIVEFKDATDAEKAITLCNSGVMCFDGRIMFDILSEIGNENAAHEYYLTDAVAIARARGLKCGVIECSAEEVAGANTREELALLESYLQKREGK